MNDIDLEGLRKEREKLVERYEELIKASIDFDGKMQSRYDTQKEETAAQANLVGELIKRMDRQIAQVSELESGNVANGRVSIGSKIMVSIDDEEPFEAVLIADTGGSKVSGVRLISANSPMGKAIEGKKIGETVLVEAPGGKISVTVTAIF